MLSGLREMTLRRGCRDLERDLEERDDGVQDTTAVSGARRRMLPACARQLTERVDAVGTISLTAGSEERDAAEPRGVSSDDRGDALLAAASEPLLLSRDESPPSNSIAGLASHASGAVKGARLSASDIGTRNGDVGDFCAA